MGNRTGRGDALILATCMVAILAGYAALFIDLPLVFLILLGILSLATVVLAGIRIGLPVCPGTDGGVGAGPAQRLPFPRRARAACCRHLYRILAMSRCRQIFLKNRPGEFAMSTGSSRPYVYIKIVTAGQSRVCLYGR